MFDRLLGKTSGVKLHDKSLAEALVCLAGDIVAEEFFKQNLPKINPLRQDVEMNAFVVDEKMIVCFDKLLEVSFQVPDIIQVVQNPDILQVCCQSAVIAVAERLRSHDRGLLVARPPKMSREFLSASVRVKASSSSLTQYQESWPFQIALRYQRGSTSQIFILRVFYAVKTV
jgi:hypothetical protein